MSKLMTTEERETEIKQYAETALLGILSNDWILNTLLTTRANDIKSGKGDIGSIADDATRLAHLFALSLFEELNK